MRKIASLLLSILIFSGLSAQPLKNRKETNCNGITHSVQDVLSSNKALLVVAIATNCSNCSDFANELNSFANFNSSKVVVWAAMNKLKGSANCNDVNDFMKKYGLTNGIFTFVDGEDHWTIGKKFTFYTVIEPVNGNIMYQGTDYREAIKRSLDAAKTASLKAPVISESKINGVYPNPLKDELKISMQVAEKSELRVRMMDILGEEKLDVTDDADPSKKEYCFDLRDYHLEKGIYFVRVEIDNMVRTFRLVKN